MEPIATDDERPILIFDGECPFCTWAADWVLRRAQGRVRAVPYQEAPLERWGLRFEDAERQAHWYDPATGRHEAGHKAMAAALAHCGGLYRPLGAAMGKPPVSWGGAAAYAVMGRVRRHLGGSKPAVKRGWRTPRSRPA